MPDDDGARRRGRFGASPGADLDIDVRANLVADEALLAQGTAAVRVATLSDRALSVGVGVPETPPYLASARSLGIRIVRRASGGTGVLHGPGDVAWALVVPRPHPFAGRDFARAYGRLGSGVVRFLHDLGIDASWAPPLGRNEGYCLLSGRGEVLRVGDRVLGGAAQHATRTALLHHGILPWKVDRPTVGRLFGLAVPDLDRLTALHELGLAPLTEREVQGFADALARSLDAP